MKLTTRLIATLGAAALIAACGGNNENGDPNNVSTNNGTNSSTNSSTNSGTNSATNSGTNSATNSGTNAATNSGTNSATNSGTNNGTVGNIAEVATEAGGFTTLLGAATDTGLDAALTAEDELTVFAPTDDAFTALGVDLDGVSGDVIANILLHHIVAGELDSAAVVAESSLTTLANTSLAVDATGDPITIGGADLSATLDVDASNGIIHVMDEVIVPPTIVEVAGATADLSSLVAAITNSSQGTQDAVAPDTLNGDDPITVFAPTNAAFTTAGVDPANTAAATLDAVLAHHVVSGQALSTDLSDGQTVTTLNGDITINVANDGSVTVTDGMGNTANVVATLVDIRTLTGVVHVIDAVLMPAN